MNFCKLNCEKYVESFRQQYETSQFLHLVGSRHDRSFYIYHWEIHQQNITFTNDILALLRRNSFRDFRRDDFSPVLRPLPSGKTITITRKSGQRCASLTCITWIGCITCITGIPCIICTREIFHQLFSCDIIDITGILVPQQYLTN